MIGSLVLVATLANCGDAEREHSDPAAPTARESVPFATVAADGDHEGGDGALLEGDLELVGGCLGVERGQTQVGLLLVDTMKPSWDDATSTVTIDGHDYAVGDSVSFGGGDAAAATLVDAVIPQECAERDTFFLVHNVE